MIINEDDISFRLIRANHIIDVNRKIKFDIISDEANDCAYEESLYLLIALSGTKVIGKWLFSGRKKPNSDYTNLYNFIIDGIKKDLKNNIYTETEKQLLKLFLKRNCERGEDRKEIEELFKANEEIINTDIIKPVNHINAGLVKYYDIANILVDQSRDEILDLIKKTYSSIIPDGLFGENKIEQNTLLEIYEGSIFPIETSGDFLLTDFLNKFYQYIIEYDMNKYLLFILYDTIPGMLPYIRYAAPILIKQDSKLTVNEAVENYYRTVYASLSNETKRRFEAYIRDYCNNNISHLQKQKCLI